LKGDEKSDSEVWLETYAECAYASFPGNRDREREGEGGAATRREASTARGTPTPPHPHAKHENGM